MPRWSPRIRKHMINRLTSYLNENLNELESHGISKVLKITDTACLIKSARSDRFACEISTPPDKACFNVAFKSSKDDDKPDDVHHLREIDAVIDLLLRRFDQYHGHDPDSEIILSRITGWSGSRYNAIKWYTSTPIPALGGYTAQQLVARGETDNVLTYLNHIDIGGYA